MSYIVKFLTIISCMFIALTMISCGAENNYEGKSVAVSTSGIYSLTTPTLDRESLNTAYANVLYWDNMNMGFGHVALEVFESSTQVTPAIYLSYAMGNNYTTDIKKHQKEPVRIKLPLRSADELSKFKTWFYNSEYYFNPADTSKYGSGYELFNHNCAHAVLNALKAFNYPVKKPNVLLVTPKTVKRVATRLLSTSH